MREYETIFVLDPGQDDAAVDGEIEKIKEIVSQDGGEVTAVEKWGRRRLAYEIRKKKEGIYTLIRFRAPATVLPGLNRRYQLNESLLRHLTVLYEAPPPSEAGVPVTVEEAGPGEPAPAEP